MMILIIIIIIIIEFEQRDLLSLVLKKANNF